MVGCLCCSLRRFLRLRENDIKKILAYSTLSQLGYMAAAFGLGFPGVALFHLITHAFKALLFRCGFRYLLLPP